MREKSVLFAVFLLSVAPWVQASAPERNEAREFIETIFMSACGHPPDPDSLDYYERVLDDRRETPEQIRDEIVQSCAPQNDACHHVLGLDSVCKKSSR